MTIIFVLLPLSLLLALCGLGAYLWAAKERQFDDLETPGFRVLFEDREVPDTRSEADHAVFSSAPRSNRE